MLGMLAFVEIYTIQYSMAELLVLLSIGFEMESELDFVLLHSQHFR